MKMDNHSIGYRALDRPSNFGVATEDEGLCPPTIPNPPSLKPIAPLTPNAPPEALKTFRKAFSKERFEIV